MKQNTLPDFPIPQVMQQGIGTLFTPKEPQSLQSLRSAFNDGGSVRDNTIGFYLSIIQMSPRTADMHPYIEEAYNWLDKNLTPAEKRQFGYLRSE